MTPRTHPAPPPVDFHCALLWLRALEIQTGRMPGLSMTELELQDLFAKYRSPWRA